MLHTAGLHYLDHIGASAHLSPLVLLHGSGRREDDLSGFAIAIAPLRTTVALRGPLRFDDGFTFFQRNPDRSLDLHDLHRATDQMCAFLEECHGRYPGKPVLVGYSNGAILAASVLARAPHLTSGAILLRPLSPVSGPIPVSLSGCPVLILSAAADERRNPDDGERLAVQLREAGASVTHHQLPGGHGWDAEGRDVLFARDWLDTHFCDA